MYERRRRTILRSISWRIVATVTTMVIAFFVTGKVELAVTIGGFELIAKLFIQYFHERLWMKIKYGYINPPDYQI